MPLSLLGTIFLLILAFFYIFSKKILLLITYLTNVLFFLCLAIALSTLFLPQLFQTSSTYVMNQTGLPQEFKKLDDTIGSITKLPQNLVDSVNPFKKQDEEQPKSLGFLEGYLLPKIIWSLGIIFQISLFMLSVALILLVIYFRYTTSSLRETVTLQKRVRTLEQQIAYVLSSQTPSSPIQNTQ